MHVVCPHCRGAVELTGPTLPPDVLCPGCGSGFRLAEGSTGPWTMPDGRRVLGRFELLEPVGAGAFGTVFKAHDRELDRLVAVKLPRAGSLAGPEHLDRFLREARSAARLRHPSIVPVHEVGQADGLPFLVSEFVRGMTLADFLSGRRPGPRDAARLAAALADALQYAHEQGVVHRDVKPSNVMLDEQGAPHLTDFGLARRDAGEVTVTLEGQVLGTPAYMSPEQASGQGHRVDGRTDVYSLGAVLYQLLTGEPPFRGNTRMLLHQVLHDEPRPPRSLNDHVPRDLETVCLKCLQKDPRRHYASARALADDLHAFLDGRPVQARPTGRLERLWRRCRRNPAVAGLSAALLLSLALGFAGVVWKWRDAERALTEADRQRRLAEGHLQDARDQRAKAEENFREARGAVDEYFTAVSENRLLKGPQPGLQPLRKELLQKALAYYQRFAEGRRDDPALHAVLAGTYRRMGRITEEIGSPKEARGLLQKAIDLDEAQLRKRPNDPVVRRGLAEAHRWLADVEHRTSRTAESLRNYERALALYADLLKESPGSRDLKLEQSRTYNGLGLLLAVLHRPDEALRAYERGLALAQEAARGKPGDVELRRGTAAIYHNMGTVYEDLLQRHDEALRWFRKALAIDGQLVRENPADLIAQRHLANHHHSIAVAHSEKGEFDESLAAAERALAIYSHLARDNPAVSQFRSDVADTYRAIGRLHRLRDEPAKALGALHKALELQEKVARDHPEEFEYRRVLGLTCNSAGVFHVTAGRYEAALGLFRGAVAVQEKLVRDHPDSVRFLRHLAIFHTNVGRALIALGRHAEAEQSLRRSGTISAQIVRDRKADAESTQNGDEVKRLLDVAKEERARCARRLGEIEGAIDQERRQSGADPKGTAPRLRLARLHGARALLQRRLGKLPEALASSRAAVGLLEKAVKAEPTDDALRRELGEACEALGRLEADAGQPAAALRTLRQALSVLPKRPDGDAKEDYREACLWGACGLLVGADKKTLSAEERAEQLRCAARASAALRRAVTAGYRDAARVRGDPDLALLREREDFQTLLSEMER
jgi:tetratricopeptide (TPR) repeat protein